MNKGCNPDLGEGWGERRRGNFGALILVFSTLLFRRSNLDPNTESLCNCLQIYALTKIILLPINFLFLSTGHNSFLHFFPPSHAIPQKIRCLNLFTQKWLILNPYFENMKYRSFLYKITFINITNKSTTNILWIGQIHVASF